MDSTIRYLLSELNINVSILCKQLRNKTYPKGSDSLQTTLQNVTYFLLLSDELRLILTHRSAVIIAIERYLKGEEYNALVKTNPVENVSIYQYCQVFFEQVECPLGSSTDELKGWVATHPDRQQVVRKEFDKFFPNVNLLLSEDEHEQLRLVSDAELFNFRTDSFLRDIEYSNALDEFNQRMQKAYSLLKAEVAVGDVLVLMKGEEKPQ